MQDLVSICILTHNQLSYTKQCLNSLFEHTSQVRSPYEVLVYDNGSTDGTISYLQGLELSGQIKVIYNKTNMGFPYGNNRLAEIAKGNYLLLLNNDVILTEGYLEKLLRCIRSDSKLAATSCYTNHSSGYQAINITVKYKGIEELNKFSKNFSMQERYVDFLVFFCCLIRRDVWDEIGGLDTRFGKGCWEDNLFCWKVIQRGYKLKIANCYIHHFSGRSFTPNEKDKQAWKDYLYLLGRNQKIFLKIINKYKTISLCMIIGQDEKPEVLDRSLASVVDYVDEICLYINWRLFPNRHKIRQLEKVIEKYDAIMVNQAKDIDNLYAKGKTWQ